MRVTTAFNRLLCLPGVSVTGVSFAGVQVTVSVRLSRLRLVCPHCGFSTRHRHDTRPVDSSWRGLDLGRWRLVVTARLRRLACPVHGVVTEAVPFARPGARFTRDVEDLVAWLATTMDKTAIARMCRLDWDTVGRIIERAVGEKLDPHRLENLFVIGVDDVSWRKGHSYLSLVSDHESKTIVWGAEGRDAATVDAFFDELGPDRAERLRAVSMDLAPAYTNSVRAHAAKAVICYDPFHVVALGTKALDTVRREHWQALRRTDPEAAKRFKGARWALLKNPTDLSEDQQATWRKLRRHGGAVWRAYNLKEALRAIFAGDLDTDQVAAMLDRFTSKASRSGLKPFLTLARTIRKHRDGILAAIRLGVNNGAHEGLNRRVRLIVNRAYGFHSAKAALALIMVTLGPVTHVLPHEHATNPGPEP